MTYFSIGDAARAIQFRGPQDRPPLTLRFCVCWGGRGRGRFCQVPCVNIENHDCHRTYSAHAESSLELTL
jgi:hypothetical protein